MAQQKSRKDAERLSEVFEQESYLMESIDNNVKVITYCRTFMSVVAGAATGILGVTGLSGFVCYFAMSLVLSLAFWLKIGGDSSKYFVKPSNWLYDGITAQFMSFILFWTLFYDLVHIY
eukprot:GFYU01007300.1.p1 GENE.GFYU01007300.1~~GFYU01007300.1.p1  ORF type:complete len:137 (-),score=25.72 GFYU01007300.1:177-533(-)